MSITTASLSSQSQLHTLLEFSALLSKDGSRESLQQVDSVFSHPKEYFHENKTTWIFSDLTHTQLLLALGT